VGTASSLSVCYSVLLLLLFISVPIYIYSSAFCHALRVMSGSEALLLLLVSFRTLEDVQVSECLSPPPLFAEDLIG